MSGQSEIKPKMKPDEIELLSQTLARCSDYVEFGTGGSTCIASALVKQSVTSLDSSREWLDKVASHCADHQDWVKPRLIYADIGTIGKWGTPTDVASQHLWPNYHEKMWQYPGTDMADVYMVDGRFRVACFLQILLHAKKDAIILVHDYGRVSYAPMDEFAERIALSTALAMFSAKPKQPVDVLKAALDRHRLIVT